MAYQGYAHGGKLQDIEWLNNYATDGLKPDLTLYFDIDPEIGLTRVHTGSGREINRLDLEKQDFHEKVRAGYQAVAEANPDRIVTLDASQSIEHVTDQAITAITTKFPGVFHA
jgi:dTMP kinase